MTRKDLFIYAYEQIKKGRMLDNYYRDNITGADVYYELISNTLHIWVEPSNEMLDYETNFYANSVNTKIGRFHKGYFIAAVRIIAEIEGLCFNSVIISGYSMGGGIVKVLTCIMADRYKYKYVRGVSMEGAKSINYRADRILKKIKNAKLYTIVNNNDTVTKIPFNFVDGGEVVKIGNEQRRWWKTGIIFRIDLSQKNFFRKFLTIENHEYNDFKDNFMEYINEL